MISWSLLWTLRGGVPLYVVSDQAPHLTQSVQEIQNEEIQDDSKMTESSCTESHTGPLVLLLLKKQTNKINTSC